MNIDIGYSVNGLHAAEYYDSEHHYDYPAFWMRCARGHKTFATVAQIESGAVSCDECAREAKAHAILQQRNKEIDEDLAAGMEETPGWLEKYGEGRINHD